MSIPPTISQEESVMYRGFWQSKAALCAVSAATAVLAVWVWVRDPDKPIYITALACVLLIVIGLMTARRVADLIAKALTTRMLETLHSELDPEAFLKAYAKVPGKFPVGTKENMRARFYLSDGYASAGDYAKAKEALGTLPEKLKEDKGICGVYYGSLAKNCLGLGESDDANAAIAELEKILGDTEGKLHANLEETLKICRAKAALAAGEIPAEAPLTEALKETAYPLSRLEIMQVLAMIAKLKGEPKRAAKYCSKMQREGGKTVYASWASKQNG